MDFDLKGYLETEPLVQSRPLLPLFEAIINAIDAVRDKENRVVNIHVERDKRQADLGDGEIRGSRPIVGFRVDDNGVGFTKANYESFNTSFSRYKKARGGKGVGRFSWLQAFDQTIVTSVYPEGTQWHIRRFTFSTAHGGLGDHSVAETNPTRQSTVVYLQGFKRLYADSKSVHCRRRVLPQTHRSRIGANTENRPKGHDLNYGRPRENATTAI